MESPFDLYCLSVESDGCRWFCGHAVCAGRSARGGAGEIAYLRDPGSSLTINDVASSAFARKFLPTDRSPLVGYTNDVIWLRLTLQREAQAPSEWLLEFNN